MLGHTEEIKERKNEKPVLQCRTAKTLSIKINV